MRAVCSKGAFLVVIEPTAAGRDPMLSGVIFENMARQRQQKEGRWAFLSGGEGAAYYRWKVRWGTATSGIPRGTAVGLSSAVTRIQFASLSALTSRLISSPQRGALSSPDAGALAAQHDPASAAAQAASHRAALGAAVGRRAGRIAGGAAAGLLGRRQLGGRSGRAAGRRPRGAAAAGAAPPPAAGRGERPAAPAAPAEPQLRGSRVQGNAATRCRCRCCGRPATGCSAAASTPGSRASTGSQGGHRS